MKKFLVGLLFAAAALVCSPAKAQDTISLKCTESFYLTDALFSLTIDGKTVVASQACTAHNTNPVDPTTGTPEVLSFAGSWGGLTVNHSIVATFLNDACGNPCTASNDRNLYIQMLTFDGTLLPPVTTPVATQVTGGIAYFFRTNDKATYTFTATAPPPVVVQPSAPTINIGTITITCSTTGVAHSVSLTWTASPTTGVTAYNVYRGTTKGGPYTKINSVNAPLVTYLDSPLTAGASYFYVVTAQAAACTAAQTANTAGGVCGESVKSNEIQAVIPTP